MYINNGLCFVGAIPLGAWCYQSAWTTNYIVGASSFLLMRLHAHIHVISSYMQCCSPSMPGWHAPAPRAGGQEAQCSNASSEGIIPKLVIYTFLHIPELRTCSRSLGILESPRTGGLEQRGWWGCWRCSRTAGWQRTCYRSLADPLTGQSISRCGVESGPRARGGAKRVGSRARWAWDRGSLRVVGCCRQHL